MVEAQYEVVEPPARLADQSGFARAIGQGAPPASASAWRAREAHYQRAARQGVTAFGIALAALCAAGVLFVIFTLWMLGAALLGLPEVYAAGPI